MVRADANEHHGSILFTHALPLTGFSIVVADADEVLKEDEEEGSTGLGNNPIYFAPYDFNPFNQGHLDVDSNSVIRGWHFLHLLFNLCWFTFCSLFQVLLMGTVVP